jgi:HSP20 family protein
MPGRNRRLPEFSTERIAMTAFIRTNGCAVTPRAILNDPWLSQLFADAPARTAQAEIRLDVEETPASFLVHADLPGVAKDQIQVEINEDVVTITVDYKRESATDAKVLRIERASGNATRSIRLPGAVDAAKADAKHVDGVLQLTLPKQAPSTRRLTIN